MMSLLDYNIHRLIPIVFVLLIGTTGGAYGGNSGDNAISLCFENDMFAGTDSGYTNGMSAALAQKLPGPLGGIWKLTGQHSGDRYATYELTQLLFTPYDLKRSTPDPSDRPYAGILYAGFMTQLRDNSSLQSFKIIAGVVGPLSLSKEAQTYSHHVFKGDLPQGWDAQLKNEPLVNLRYEYRHRFSSSSTGEGFAIELLPIGSAQLGNLTIQGGFEAQLRFGYNIGDDFGVTTLRGTGYLPFNISDSRSTGGYLFIGNSGSLTGRDLTLDGNTFRNGPKVDRYPATSTISFGASLRLEQILASFVYVIGSREFTGQRIRPDYGAMKLTYSF